MAKKEVKENKQSKQNSHYFKDMKAELKKVIWPTPKQVLNSTVAVIVFTLIIAAIVFVLDLCFDSINTYGITALQEKIQTAYSESQSSEEDEESDDNTTGDSETSTDEDESSNSEASEDENTASDNETSTDGNTTSNENTAE